MLLDGKRFNTLPSPALSIVSSDATSQNYSVHEQFVPRMRNYFQSSNTAKDGMDLLASTWPDNIDIHVDNRDYLNLSFDLRLATPSTRQPDTTYTILEGEKVPLSDRIKQKLMHKQASNNVMSGMLLKPDCLQSEVSDV